MIKMKKIPPRLRRLIRHLKRRQVNMLNSNTKIENPWLFERNSRKEIQNLVFQQHDDIPSPRLHENVFYHNIIMSRIEEVLEKRNPNIVDVSEDASSNFISRNSKLMKRSAVTDIKFVPENISLTAQINVIPHANEVAEDKKMIRKPTVMAIKETNSLFEIERKSSMQSLVFIEK